MKHYFLLKYTPGIGYNPILMNSEPSHSSMARCEFVMEFNEDGYKILKDRFHGVAQETEPTTVDRDRDGGENE